MKKVSLDTWIQLLGMIGLLGGLVFVGLEMQQNQTIALAAQANARTEMLLSKQTGLLNCPILECFHGQLFTTRQNESDERVGIDYDPVVHPPHEGTVPKIPTASKQQSLAS